MVSAPPKPGIEGILSELKAQNNATVTYISRVFEPGQKIWLPQAVLLTFDEPGDVAINNLAYHPNKMFVAHYAQMWLEPKTWVKVGYVIPGKIALPTGGAALKIMPSHIYVSPEDGKGSLGAVLTSTREDAVAAVLRGQNYRLETRSPQLAYIDGLEVVNYDESPINVRGTVLITPQNIVGEHSKPISLDILPGTEISYL